MKRDCSQTYTYTSESVSQLILSELILTLTLTLTTSNMLELKESFSALRVSQGKSVLDSSPV